MNSQMAARIDGFEDSLAELYDIGLTLTKNLDDPDELLHKVAKSARHLLGADIAVCYAYDQDTNTYELSAHVGTLLKPKMGRVPRRGGPTDTIVHTNEPLIVQNTQTEDTPFLSSPFTQNEGVKSVIGYPLMSTDTEGEKEVVGVLYVNYREADRITQDVERVVGLLANQAAVAIFNARLIHRLKEREEDTTRLVDIVRNISEAIANSNRPATKSTVKLVLDEIARTACQLVGADCAVIYPWDKSQSEYFETEHIGAYNLHHPIHPRERPRSASGMAAYVKKEQMIWVDDIAREDPDMFTSWFIQREDIKAFVAVSVEVGGVYLAMLYVNFRKTHRLLENEKRIIRMFADQVGVALQIARLLEEEQRARSNLEMLGIWNQIGGAFAHRLANIVGPVPVAVRQVRRELNKLGTESATIEEWLTQIEMATTYLRQMTERLRKVKDFRQVPESVDINAMLSDVIRQSKLYNQAENIKLNEQYNDHLPPVLIQKTQIQEVFMNIVNNAVDVMTSGGSLTAATRHVQRADGELIEVTISDTGPGMTKEKQERIFELFYGDKEGGMGFGLWWSRAFLRFIQGDVQVLSERGRGSTFIVTIPLPNQ